MKRIAVFPGSFDPFTIGHESIVLRSLPLFDEIIVAIGHNSAKQSFFSLEKRIEHLNKIFENEPRVHIEEYSGLTVDFCLKRNANYILRGLRTSADFEFERAIGQVNRAMHSEVETIFILTLPEHSAISSTIVREIIRYNGNVTPFMPQKGFEILFNDSKK